MITDLPCAGTACVCSAVTTGVRRLPERGVTLSDLIIRMEDSAVWFRLKEILCEAIMAMPDCDEKRLYLRFMASNWPGHAPRSREVATLVSEMTSIKRERDKLVILLRLPTAGKGHKK